MQSVQIELTFEEIKALYKVIAPQALRPNDQILSDLLDKLLHAEGRMFICAILREEDQAAAK